MFIKKIPKLYNIKDVGIKHTWESFEIISHYLIILYCLFAGLSIFASQVFLAALFLFWISLYIKEKPQTLFITKEISDIWLALFLWIFISIFSALIGVSPKDALPESLKIGLFAHLSFIVCFCLRRNPSLTIEKTFTYLFSLLISFAIAAFHTAISNGISPDLLPRTPGPVTESGQLVLIFPIAIVLTEFTKKISKFKTSLYGLISFCCFVAFCWPNVTIANQNVIQFLSAFIVLIAVIYSSNKVDKTILKSILVGLIFGALVVNLKRGPWLGVIAELVLLGILLSRNLLFTTVFGCSLLLILEPARDRILSLVDHFTIEGGRLDMWAIGVEMAARFPLGLGLDNAEFMRQLEPSMPPTHRHMHNNLLNITVETGWLGLAAYLWWLYLILKLSINLWRSFSNSGQEILAKLSLSIGVAILGWQISGLVEYNFGDTEIQLIALFLMGVLFSLSHFSKPDNTQIK